jgi:hypothetical protein
MMTSVWICVALWFGLNAGFVGLRLYVTRQNAPHISARSFPVTVDRQMREIFDRLQAQKI